MRSFTVDLHPQADVPPWDNLVFTVMEDFGVIERDEMLEVICE